MTLFDAWQRLDDAVTALLAPVEELCLRLLDRLDRSTR